MNEIDLWIAARWTIGGALAGFGILFALIAAMGLFRRRPVAVATHALAACDTLAWPLVVLGVAIAAWDWAVAGAGVALLIARWATTPVALQTILANDLAASDTSSSRHG